MWIIFSVLRYVNKDVFKYEFYAKYINHFSIVLQILFTICSIRNGPFNLSDLPWYIYVIVVLIAVVNIPIQELVKKHDRSRWLRFQKFLKLQFNTKLGMHSPL
jgi:cell division protein FtsW (lipid II flippase)